MSFLNMDWENHYVYPLVAKHIKLVGNHTFSYLRERSSVEIKRIRPAKKSRMGDGESCQCFRPGSSYLWGPAQFLPPLRFLGRTFLGIFELVTFFLSFFLVRILVLQPGIEPMLPAVEFWSLQPLNCQGSSINLFLKFKVTQVFHLKPKDYLVSMKGRVMTREKKE